MPEKQQKPRSGALIFEWPDFVAEHALAGSVAKPLPTLAERYSFWEGQETIEVKGCQICVKCGHWEASYERVAGLGAGKFPCKCCRERAAQMVVEDDEKKAGARARTRSERRSGIAAKRVKPAGQPEKRAY